MRPRAAATSTTDDAGRGISRPMPLVVLRVTCVLALLVLAATWIPLAEAVVSVTRTSLKCVSRLAGTYRPYPLVIFVFAKGTGVTIKRWSGVRVAPPGRLVDRRERQGVQIGSADRTDWTARDGLEMVG